jgi:outer membrane receptor protein involved in Fe transport
MLVPPLLPNQVAFGEDPGFGYLTGTVYDSGSNEVLPYSNVVFSRATRDNPAGEAAGGTMAFDDGVYFRKVKAGTYIISISHISYEPAKVQGIFVAAGDTVTVDARLASTSSATVEKVVVTGKIVRTAEGSMLRELQKGATVGEALTSEQIGKASDGNTAEALERVTGVSLVDGRYVFVRGLGERYSQTTVNGAGVGTPEPNKRVVPMDIFPTGLVDNITVHKTFTPDMEGEFGGSVINIKTKDFGKNAFKQSLSLGHRSSVGSDFLSYSGGGLDFLGFDDGTRALPDIVERVAGDRRVDPQSVSKAEIAEMGTAFTNVWTPQGSTPKPDFSYSALISRKAHALGKDVGLLATAYLSNATGHREKQDNTYSGSSYVSPLYLYQVDESMKTVLGGATASATVKLNETDKVKLNFIYTRHSEDKARISQGQNDDRGSHVRSTQLTYVERGLFSGVLQGENALGLLGSNLHWNLALSRGYRGEPDRRTSLYEDRDDSGMYKATGAGSVHPFQRIFGESVDHSKSVKLDWTVPLGEASSVKTGAAYRIMDRTSEFRRFGFTKRFDNQTVVDLTLPPEGLLSTDNIEDGVYTLEELTAPNDSYAADQTIQAGYTMVDVPFSHLRLVAGARYEESRQNVEAGSNYASTMKSTFVEQDDKNVLPSVNLTYVPHRDVNVRLAYAKTVNRPELRELSPFSMYNFETGYSETGDTNLVTSRIDNYDTRIEYYPGPGEFLAVGAFYKDFERPIQKFIAGTTGGYALRPQNARGAKLHGWEAEIRVSGRSVWKALDWTMDLGPVPALMNRWSLAVNYSRVESEVEVLNRAGEPETKPFSGQSKYSANAGAFYGHKRWEGGILYKAFGKRLDAFGLGLLPDIYEYPPRTLDAVLSYRISGSSRIKVTAENLMDEAVEFRQAGLITQRYKKGISFGISFSYEPESGDPES